MNDKKHIVPKEIKAGSAMAHALVEKAEQRLAFLEARTAIIECLRIYNAYRLSNAGTNDWTMAMVQPLLCFMGWEGRTQELKELLSEAAQTARELPDAKAGLLPCPFCGHRVIQLYHEDGTYDRAYCVGCGANICSHHARKDWNTRAPLTVSPWIRTAERAPTKEDANLQGGVLASDGVMSMVQKWHYVIEHNWPFWMPIPPLPALLPTKPTDAMKKAARERIGTLREKVGDRELL